MACYEQLKQHNYVTYKRNKLTNYSYFFFLVKFIPKPFLFNIVTEQMNEISASL